MPGNFLEFFFIPTWGPIWAMGAWCGAGALLKYFSDTFFVVPKTSGASQVIFWKNFYPHIWNVGINLSPHVFTNLTSLTMYLVRKWVKRAHTFVLFESLL
jgi:hypothetical protein